MAGPASEDVTQLLAAASAGRRTAAAELMELVYEELRGLARRQMADLHAGGTLQATALVHEAYLRLFSEGIPSWNHRAHFFFAAARAMRDILVSDARRQASLKRGGGRKRITLDEGIASTEPDNEDLLALDEALRRLDATDKAAANVIMLRYFAGLSIEDTARAIGISPATVKRYWYYARAWLRSQICGESVQPEGGPGDGS